MLGRRLTLSSLQGTLLSGRTIPTSLGCSKVFTVYWNIQFAWLLYWTILVLFLLLVECIFRIGKWIPLSALKKCVDETYKHQDHKQAKRRQLNFYIERIGRSCFLHNIKHHYCFLDIYRFTEVLLMSSKLSVTWTSNAPASQKTLEGSLEVMAVLFPRPADVNLRSGKHLKVLYKKILRLPRTQTLSVEWFLPLTAAP